MRDLPGTLRVRVSGMGSLIPHSRLRSHALSLDRGQRAVHTAAAGGHAGPSPTGLGARPARRPREPSVLSRRWRTVLRGAIVILIVAIPLVGAVTPASAADAGAMDLDATAAHLPRLSRSELARCFRTMPGCDGPRMDRLLRAHRRRDVGVALGLAAPAVGFTGGLMVLRAVLTQRSPFPGLATLGVSGAMLLASPLVLASAVGGARPMLFERDRKLGTGLLVTAFLAYGAGIGFAVNTNAVGDGAGLVVGGGLYLAGTGLLWAAANDALGKARRTVLVPVAIAPHPLPGGAGLRVIGHLGRLPAPGRNRR